MMVKRLGLLAVCLGCLSFMPTRAEAGMFGCFKKKTACPPATPSYCYSGGYYAQYPNGQLVWVPTDTTQTYATTSGPPVAASGGDLAGRVSALEGKVQVLEKKP